MLDKAVLTPLLFGLLPFLPLEGPPEPPPAVPAASASEFREVVLPQSNKVEGLALSPDQKVSAGKRFVIVQATTDKPEQKVKWVVLSSAPGHPPAAVVSPSGKSIMVFLGDHADLIAVMAYSATAAGPTDTAVCKITVEGPAPPEGPAGPGQAGPGRAPSAPPVAARPVVGRLHVTLILDLARQTPEVATLRSSTRLRTSLRQVDCEYHEYPAAQAPADMRGVLRAEGLAPPAAIVQDQEGNIRELAPVTTAEALLALVERARKGR